MRSPMLAKVHIARKELALEEEDYRAILQRVCGKPSSSGCSDTELDRLLTEFKRLGWKPRSKGFLGHSDKPHVRKVFALWKELGRAGVLTDGSRKALHAFVKRQTGVAAAEWLTAADASKVTEGLKAMQRRQKPKAGA